MFEFQAPGVTISFGSRDNRGYYWDGYDYREQNIGKNIMVHVVKKYYTGRGKQWRASSRWWALPTGSNQEGNC